MKAIILAAGEGKRLRPYTLDRPKCLVPLAGHPLLMRQISVLRACGLDDITVMTGYRADQIERLGLRTIHNPEYATTNMVVSLMCARELLNSSSDLLIAYADIVYEPRIVEAIVSHTGAFCTTIDLNWQGLWEARQESPLEDAETLKLDDTGNIVELGKVPQTLGEIEGQYMGLIKVSATMASEMVASYDALDPTGNYDGKDRANMYMTSFLQHLIDSGFPLQAVEVENGWLEVDTTEDLERYERMNNEAKLDRFVRLDLTNPGDRPQ